VHSSSPASPPAVAVRIGHTVEAQATHATSLIRRRAITYAVGANESTAVRSIRAACQGVGESKVESFDRVASPISVVAVRIGLRTTLDLTG
jgi:hypothetical protein